MNNQDNKNNQSLESSIHKDSFSNNFLPLYQRTNSIEYYDIIINIDSFQNLHNGWEMKFNQEGYEQYERQKDKKNCVVGIVGNANKGKTFILQQLIGIELPTGYSVKTEGLSLKYPVLENQNVILLDSAGLETPIKNDECYHIDKDLNSDVSTKMITAIARDKQVTELFLQQFVIQNSNILILVVGILTYSDQKLLNRIKRDLTNSGRKLFVVHNLYPYVTKEQVSEYIEDVLKKSLTFKLEEQVMRDLSNKCNNSQSKKKNDKYYVEEQNSSSYANSPNIPSSIVHLIMANDSSEAGDYYNSSTINHLQQQCICYTSIEAFPIIPKLKGFLYKMSGKLMEKKIDSENDILTGEKIIKLEKKVELKRCFVDELGFSNFFGCAITPAYSHYIFNGDFIIELELPGEIKLSCKVQTQDANLLFIISGEKLEHPMKKTPGNEFESNQESGFIYLEIAIPHAELSLKSKRVKNILNEDGLVRLFFDIEEDKDDDGEQVLFI